MKRYRVTIHKDGQVNGYEISSSLFRVKAGTRISFHVEYLIGGRCKVRPTYKVFPLLEQVGR